MFVDLVLQGLVASIAGLSVAICTAYLSQYREDQRWIRENVYQPLYEEVINVIAGTIPQNDNGYASIWASIEYYKTYRVDEKFKVGLDRYSNEINELTEIERKSEIRSFIDALPDHMVKEDSTIVTLPSGRKIDLRLWLKRNMLVLACSPRFSSEAFGLKPSNLSYLWGEITGIDKAAIRSESFDTEQVLYEVSVEFNWGYENLYAEWRSDWLGSLEDAFLAVATDQNKNFQETLTARQSLGETANDIKRKIENRAEKGLLRRLASTWLTRTFERNLLR